jgi:hypothetical protein
MNKGISFQQIIFQVGFSPRKPNDKLYCKSKSKVIFVVKSDKLHRLWKVNLKIDCEKIFGQQIKNRSLHK